jgi:hypothetical protein
MAFADGVKLAGVELFGGVLADRLEQLVAAAVALLQQQRLLDEPCSEVCDPRRGLAVARADLLDRREVEPTGEHCHPPQEPPLLLRQQGVAPLHRRTQRPLRTVSPPRRLREQTEQIIEVNGDVLQIEPDHPCRGKLDRKRQAIDAAADLSEQTPRAIGVERRLRPSCPAHGGCERG